MRWGGVAWWRSMPWWTGLLLRLRRAETSAFSRETLKPRYFVLLPKHLAYFAKPAEATVVEARLISDFMHTSLSALRGHGTKPYDVHNVNVIVIACLQCVHVHRSLHACPMHFARRR